jgi:hypothetical protein
MLGALVDAAVFIGRADGRFSEAELNVFIDSMREVVSAAVGDDASDDFTSTPKLLDLARAARARLQREGADAFLASLAPRFHGPFGRDGLVLAYRIVLADGRVTAEEAAAFRRLAEALGLEVAETEALEALARPARTERATEAIARVNALHAQGWAPVPDSVMDASARFVQPDGGRVDLEFDTTDGTLHVQLSSGGEPGPHLLCRVGEALPGLLAVLEAIKTSLTPATLDEKLPALKAVCPELFLEADGRVVKK